MCEKLFQRPSLTPALEFFPDSQRSSELISTGKTRHLWRRLSDSRSSLIPGSQLHDSLLDSRSLTSTVPTGPFQRLLNHKSPLLVRVPPLRIPSVLCLLWGSAAGDPGPGFPPLRALTPRRLSQSVAPLPPSGPPRSHRADPRLCGGTRRTTTCSNLTSPLTS